MDTTLDLSIEYNIKEHNAVCLVFVHQIVVKFEGSQEIAQL